jgi:hypothetical protein
MPITSPGLARLSSAAMFASGIAAVLQPEIVAGALHLSPTDARGRAESRAGFGGTFAALGAFGLLSRSPAAQRAIGVTWLGAAAARLAALRLDDPETDATFWAYLAGEVGLGTAALVGAGRRGSS